MTATAAIHFEPEGYVLTGPKLMGRQAAGNAFLRAAVRGRGGDPVWAFTPHKKSAQVFADVVKSVDAGADARWISPSRLDMLAGVGALYLPGPLLRDPASVRLRVGPLAYSLVGVTHTTASHAVMDGIAGLVSDPVMPWDAVVCTSDAVLTTVHAVLEAEQDYLKWRLGVPVPAAEVMLPVIPLGVHGADFEFSVRDRRTARETLGIGKDEVVALFVGRLSFHGKAHPHAMYLGLEEAARRTGKKLVLVQCGWFANEPIETAFKDGARRFCPSVRCLYTDGKDPAARSRSWAAADFFCSLSDNIQETFGLTPLEALAAGLPVIVTDWDGYKETVRDGIDGFRIPTVMPPAGLGQNFAKAYETGSVTYDQYCGLTCRTVSVDLAQLTDRLADLAGNPELRQRLGAAGKLRVRNEFDWSVVYRRYQDLYRELAGIRAAAANSDAVKARLAGAPKAASGRLDPFHLFGHYATRRLNLDSILAVQPGATAAVYTELARHALFAYLPEWLPTEKIVGALLAALTQRPVAIGVLSETLGIDPVQLTYFAAILAKMGLVRVEG